MKLHIATAPSKSSRHWQQGTTTWPDLLLRLARDPADHKDCGGYVLGLLAETTEVHEGKECTGLHRTKDAVVTRSALALDADYALSDFPEQVKRLGWQAVVHPTWRHTLAGPRYRLVCPFDRPVTPAEYTRISRVVMAKLGVEQFDPGSVEPERFMFWPSAQDPASYRRWVFSGDRLPVDALLAEADELPAEEPLATSDGTPYADLDSAQQALADLKVERVVGGFRRRLDEAEGWDDGERDERGRGWERLTTDAAFALAQLGVAEWAPLTLDEAEALFHELVPADIAADPKCHGKWDASRVRSAAANPVPPPWLDPEWSTAEGDFPDDLPPGDALAEPARRSEILRRLRPGGAFLLDIPEQTPAVWGRGNEVLWAQGEALTLAGPPGVGRTTLAGQVVGARLTGGEVLGFPVEPTRSKVLYLAMDRPMQIGRALRRTLGHLDRELLDERLVFWPGPPIQDVAAHPSTLLKLARTAGADTVVVDSLKDAAVGLSNDEVGAGYNRARQLCTAAGIEVLELHHMVKKGDNGSPPTSLADMYGSAWISAGAGSVILLHGVAGDTVVTMRHLKQPAEEVGPYLLLHDHTAGHTTIYEETDVVAMALAAGQEGLTPTGVARQVNESDKPSKAQVNQVRRKLDSAVRAGRLTVSEDSSGGRGGRQPTTYRHPSYDDFDTP